MSYIIVDGSVFYAQGDLTAGQITEKRELEKALKELEDSEAEFSAEIASNELDIKKLESRTVLSKSDKIELMVYKSVLQGLISGRENIRNSIKNIRAKIQECEQEVQKRSFLPSERDSFIRSSEFEIRELSIRLSVLRSNLYPSAQELDEIKRIEQQISKLRSDIERVKHASEQSDGFTTIFREVREQKPNKIQRDIETKYLYVDICKDIFGEKNDAASKSSVIEFIQKWILHIYSDYTCSFKGEGKLKSLYIKNDPDGHVYKEFISMLRRRFNSYWKTKRKMYELVCQKVKISKEIYDDLLTDPKIEAESFVVFANPVCKYIKKSCVDALVDIYLANREKYVALEQKQREKEIKKEQAKIAKQEERCHKKAEQAAQMSDKRAAKEAQKYRTVFSEDSEYTSNLDFLRYGDSVARAIESQTATQSNIVNHSSMPDKMRELTKMIQCFIMRCQDWYEEVKNEKRKARIKNIILDLARDLYGQDEYIRRCWQLDVKPIAEQFKQGNFLSVEEVKEFFAPVFAVPRIKSAKPVYIR